MVESKPQSAPWRWKWLLPVLLAIAVYQMRPDKEVIIANAGYVNATQQTVDTVPVQTWIANYSFPQYRLTQEQLNAYNMHGWVLLPKVIPESVLDVLLEEAEQACSEQVHRRAVCQIEQLRWQLDHFRDFLLHGPLGGIVAQVTGAQGVRVNTEALFGLRHAKKDPEFFSYYYHTDTPGDHPGVFHGFPTGTKAAAVWFPLHAVNHTTQGGGIKVIDGYPMDNCKWRKCGGLVKPTKMNAPMNYSCDGCRLYHWQWRDCDKFFCKSWAGKASTLSFEKGDIVIWHSDMPHASQSVLDPSFKRHAFTVRFVDSEATMCDVSRTCGMWLPCCKDAVLKNGVKIHHHCWPQVYPTALKHEVNAHFASYPKPLMAPDGYQSTLWNVPKLAECDQA